MDCIIVVDLQNTDAIAAMDTADLIMAASVKDVKHLTIESSSIKVIFATNS